MKICVLQPALQDLQNSEQCWLENQLVSLFPDEQVEVITLQKATLYRQLKQLKKQKFDIFVNLCQGYRDGETASCYEVTAVLEELNLPYTGSPVVLYDTPKQAMKHIAYYAGVETPAFAVAETLDEVEQARQDLQFPLFVKPAAATGCLGIDERSHISSSDHLLEQVGAVIRDHEVAFIEEYISGREFTVLVAAHPDATQAPIVYTPIEAEFPDQQPFQTQNCKAPSYRLCTGALRLPLQEAARQIFSEVNQGGYACIDFRVNAEGEIFFIDINSPCPILCPGSIADAVLQLNGITQAAFLKQVIAEGIARHQRRQRKYQVKKSAIATYGIFAAQDFQAGEVIVAGEAFPHKIVTRSHVQTHWTAEKRTTFLRYTQTLNADTFILRDPRHPADWLLQNHSCNPNTAYQGLDLIATRTIVAGEELTIDFATFRDESGSIEFDCQCGSLNCRGYVSLQPCLSDLVPAAPPKILAETLIH